jgi:hypothetical protein
MKKKVKSPQESAVIGLRKVATGEDRMRPREESLAGSTAPRADESDAVSMDSLSRDPSDPPAHHGSQTPDLDGSDEDKNTERLVSDGVEKAELDQMLAALRKREQ